MKDNSVASRLKKKGIEQWEISNAVDTLIRAEEIKKNNDLMFMVEKEITKRKEAMDSIKTK